MPYKIGKQGSAFNIPIIEVYCDTEAELSDLPTNFPMGSVAYIIENATVYMINSKGEWIKQ